MKKFVILLVLIAIVGGLGYWGASHRDHFHHHSLMDEIQEHEFHGVHDFHPTYHYQDLDTSEFMKIHFDDPEIKSFFTPLRAKEITSFPCQNCHDGPLSQMKSKNEGEANAHWDIELNHADGQVMNCTTCHHEGQMNELTSLQGEAISLDESFKLCGQCHSTQYKDWKGGAHGKNISGWQAPRVIKTCVNCHNPHQPAFESRWPSRLNRTSITKIPNH